MFEEEFLYTIEYMIFFLDSILSYCIQQMQRKRDSQSSDEMNKLETAKSSARKVQELWRKHKDFDGG